MYGSIYLVEKSSVGGYDLGLQSSSCGDLFSSASIMYQFV